MLERLLDGARSTGSVGALRVRASYQPTAGDGAKIAPPTYPNVGYLLEERYIDGEKRATVVVDSVQSEANRVEEALIDAIDAGAVELPYLVTEADIEGVKFRVTSLEAPHRSPDAYFRDSETLDGDAFDDSSIGQELRLADERHARALYRYSVTDLALGVWDSQRGGRGLRLPRAFTSEMIGLDPLLGARAAGRLDPYNIPSTQVFYDKADRATWSLDKADLAKDVKAATGKTSNVNHGNALASEAPGGVAVSSVERLAVLSLKVLRRLRFPDDTAADPAVDAAGRVVVAALVILADRLAFADASVYLRSGCDLTRVSEHAEWIGPSGAETAHLPDVDGALDLFADAVAHASSLGLEFAAPIVLRPKDNLRSLLALTFASAAPADEG